ncbi:MAG: peptidyl-prolyl cis-trans isomerase [Rhodovibrionaceae bacterium]|nr:peptidyl-prolyl cis-trans isomerase [Rhodovibrionaceae bacterium]
MPAKFQKKLTKILVSILFGLLILSFAVWGIGDIFRGEGLNATVVRVGEQKIDYVEVQNILQQRMSNLRQQLGSDITLEDLRSLGFVDRTIQQVIARSLFEEKARQMGLAVTREQVAGEIQNQPAFQGPTGRFDPNQFRFFLRTSGITEQRFVGEITSDLQRERLIRAVSSGVAAPTELAKRIYAFRNETRVARIAEVPFESLDDIPQPDDATLVKYYEDNPTLYEAPEYRAVTLVQLRPERLAEEIAISEEELREAFDSRREEFETPERRHVRQIVFENESAAQDATARLREGVSFETVAQEATGSEPVDLGLLTRGDLPDGLQEAAFSIGEGEISDPAQSDFGWHVMQITEIQPGETVSFEAVRDDLREDLALREAVDDAVSIANQLDDELAAGATMEEAAASLGLRVKKIPAISRNGNAPSGEAVEGLPPVAEIAPVIFDTPSGEQSLLQETSDGGYFVLRVDGVQPPDVRPFDKVRDQVLNDWLADQRSERARQRAEIIAQAVRNGQDFEKTAEEAGLDSRLSEPIGRQDADPAGTGTAQLTGALFGLEKNEVATVVGADRAVVAQLVDIQPADPARAPDEVTALQGQLSQAMMSDLVAQYGEALRNQFTVSVNRRLLDEILATYY